MVVAYTRQATEHAPVTNNASVTLSAGPMFTAAVLTLTLAQCTALRSYKAKGLTGRERAVCRATRTIVVSIADASAVTKCTVIALPIATAHQPVGTGSTSNGAITASKVGVTRAFCACNQRTVRTDGTSQGAVAATKAGEASGTNATSPEACRCRKWTITSSSGIASATHAARRCGTARASCLTIVPAVATVALTRSYIGA